MSNGARAPRPLSAAPDLSDVLPPCHRRGQIATFIYRFPTIAAGGFLLAVIVAIALLAPWLGTVDPAALAPAHRTRPPGAQHWFGTDMLGRNVYSRVLYGTRVSVIVGVSVAFSAAAIGTTIGLISGFIRRLDAVVMRMMDGMMSIPPILLAIALMALTRMLGAERHYRHHHRRGAARQPPGARRGAEPA